MAILGLLVLAAAVAVGVETVYSNRTTEVVEVFGTFSAVPMSVVFLFGALCATVALLGLMMITGRFQKRRRMTAKHRMQETQTMAQETDRTNAELVEENDRLRAELASERRAAATLGGVAVPPGAGNVAYGDQVSDAVRSDTISQTGRFDPYPTEHGNDGAVNTEAARNDAHDGSRDGSHDGSRDNSRDDSATTQEHAGFTGRLRGNP